MSAKLFIKDITDYFVDIEFSETDKKRLESIFHRHAQDCSKVLPVYRDRVIDRTIKVPVYIERQKTVYVDSVSGRFLNYKNIGVINASMDDVNNVIDSVCEAWKVERDKVLGNCRERRFTYPRFFICHYLRNLGMTFKMISVIFKRDHSTIIQAVRASERLIACNVQPYSRLWLAFNEKPNLVTN